MVAPTQAFERSRIEDGRSLPLTIKLSSINLNEPLGPILFPALGDNFGLGRFRPAQSFLLTEARLLVPYISAAPLVVPALASLAINIGLSPILPTLTPAQAFAGNIPLFTPFPIAPATFLANLIVNGGALGSTVGPGNVVLFAINQLLNLIPALSFIGINVAVVGAVTGPPVDIEITGVVGNGSGSVSAA
jgi:hypothetical protein